MDYLASGGSGSRGGNPQLNKDPKKSLDEEEEEEEDPEEPSTSTGKGCKKKNRGKCNEQLP